MRIVVILVTCWASLRLARRVKVETRHTHREAYQNHQTLQNILETEINFHSRAELKQLQSRTQAEAWNPLRALAVLLLNCSSAAGWRHSRREGHAGPKPPRLSHLHESILKGPLGRRYTDASLVRHADNNGRRQVWTLGFTQTDVQDGGSSARQSSVLAADFERGIVESLATLPVTNVVISRDPATGLELRTWLTKQSPPEVIMEIWEGDVRMARHSELGTMGTLLPAGIFGSPSWSASGNAVTWVAAAPISTGDKTTYWQPEDLTDEYKVLEGSFQERHGLGEALDADNSVIVKWKWRGEVSSDRELQIIHAREVIPDPDWPTNDSVAVLANAIHDGTDDGLIFSVYFSSPWLRGLVGCLNRPTRLYHLSLTQLDSKARCLTPELYLANFPRLSPDGKTLAFVGHANFFAGHATPLELRAMKWPVVAGKVEESVVLVSNEAPGTENGSDSPLLGLSGFHEDMASLAWLNSTTLVFQTLINAQLAVFLCDLTFEPRSHGHSHLRRLVPPIRDAEGELPHGSVELLAVGGGTCMLQWSSLKSPNQVWACRPKAGDPNLDEWLLLCDTAQMARLSGQEETSAALEALKSATLERVSRPSLEGGAEALVLLPAHHEHTASHADSEETSDAEITSEAGQRLPWVLLPHGGPHAVATDSWNTQSVLLVASNCALIFPNYRGSLSYGREFCETLLGNIGDMDVEDCGELTRLVLSSHPQLDPERGAVYGGSHGGYLAAWLLGSDKYKMLFRGGGVLWNPVIDLLAMVATTDIPDWVWAQGLASSRGPVWPLTPAEVEQLRLASPISVVDQVDTPALMLLGAADQRVPPSQGRQWVSARRQQQPGAEVTVLEYPNCGHAIQGIEANAHAKQSAISWLLRQLTRH